MQQKDAQEENKSEPAATTLDGLIINSVRLKPSLWDPENAKKFPSQTWELWERVCLEVGFPITSRDVIKNIWLSWRKKFMGARSRAIKRKPSGAASTAKKSRFVFYDQMMFLADTVDVPE